MRAHLVHGQRELPSLSSRLPAAAPFSLPASYRYPLPVRDDGAECRRAAFLVLRPKASENGTLILPLDREPSEENKEQEDEG